MFSRKNFMVSFRYALLFYLIPFQHFFFFDGEKKLLSYMREEMNDSSYISYQFHGTIKKLLCVSRFCFDG